MSGINQNNPNHRPGNPAGNSRSNIAITALTATQLFVIDWCQIATGNSDNHVNIIHKIERLLSATNNSKTPNDGKIITNKLPNKQKGRMKKVSHGMAMVLASFGVLLLFVADKSL